MESRPIQTCHDEQHTRTESRVNILHPGVPRVRASGVKRLCEVDLALDAQRRRSRRARHHGAADDVDPAPSAASAVGMAAPRALTLGTTGTLALAAAEALLRCPVTFMAFTWRVG